jgi:uncharacterized protein (DUF4415 family)
MKKPRIARDGEVRELDRAFFAQATRGRPPMPGTTKKRRVNLMLDSDVADRLQDEGNASAFVNTLLRDKLGM